MWTKQVTESHIIAVLQLIKLCKQKAKENQYPLFVLSKTDIISARVSRLTFRKSKILSWIFLWKFLNKLG